MAKLAVHVLQREDGKWIVKRAGKRIYRVCDTRDEAIEIGRKIAINKATELIVHRPDGSIRSKDTFGPDPFPRKTVSRFRGSRN